MFVLLLGCSPTVDCGAGTHKDGTTCVADEADTALPADTGDSPPDTGTADDTADSDTGAHTADDTGADSGADSGVVDADGDGFPSDVDCDDDDAAVHPDAEEVCANGIDDNCDGTSAVCAWSGRYAIDEPGYALRGEFSNDYAGIDVRAGDLDGDGHGDLVVGAHMRGDAADRAGSVYVVRGPVTSDLSLATDATARIDGADYYGYLGRVMRVSPDVDADGDDELVLRDTIADCGESGVVYVFSSLGSGTAGTADADHVIEGDDDSSALGQSLAAGGDVTGDGVPDIVAGEGCGYPANSVGGSYWVLSGAVLSSGTVDEVTDIELRPREPTAASGRTAAFAGDLDGDGVGDLLLGGSPSGESSRAVLQVPGPLDGNAYLDDVATAVLYPQTAVAEDLSATALDLDGDGHLDIALAGVGRTASDPGSAWIFLGPVSGELDTLYADATVETAHDNYGSFTGLDAPGDVDGDGTADLLLADEDDDRYGAKSGAAYLFPGPISGTGTVDDFYTVAFHGASSNDYVSVATGIGDHDGDGSIDLLVGAYGAEGDVDGAGAAFLLLSGG